MRSQLKQEIKDRILARETTVGLLADALNIQAYSVKINLDRNAPCLCLPHWVREIKLILNIPENEEITEIITEETHLHE